MDLTFLLWKISWLNIYMANGAGTRFLCPYVYKNSYSNDFIFDYLVGLGNP